MMDTQTSGRPSPLRLRRFVTTTLAGAAFAVGIFAYWTQRLAEAAPPARVESLVVGQTPTAAPDAAEGRAAFLKAYTVFMHARCMNCHPAGDRPLQGDDSHPHAQNVKRGPDGHGLYALKCANCHQTTNLPGEHMPPGSPTWHLPPPEKPLVFEGLSPAVLATRLKDPKQNGGKTLQGVLFHVSRDRLVVWGWEPGDGRTLPPLSHEEFVAAMETWVAAGAPIPEE